MTTYILTELQNAQSSRQGVRIDAANLTAAKRKASRMQMFQGTVLELAFENGARVALKENGTWVDL